MFTAPRKILIVDDSPVYRRFVQQTLEGLQGHRIVGQASDGVTALQAIATLRPDVITLDVEMPGMSGLEVLKQIKQISPQTEVIMLSSLTLQSASLTIQAIESGAFDFVLKPQGTDLESNRRKLHKELSERFQVISQNVTRNSGGGQPQPSSSRPAWSPTPTPTRVAASPPGNVPRRAMGSPQIIVIGISTGGPQALRSVVSQLPSDFSVPIAVVQHMPPLFTRSLAEELDRISPLQVFEGTAGDILRAGQIAIAPGGFQMRLQRSANGIVLRVNDDPPERSCRPSVNVLFRSAAEQFGGRAVGVVMTGMGDDGTEGSRAMREQGAHILAQDARSCVVYGMPCAVAEAGLVDEVVGLNDVASKLTALSRRPVLAGRS
ncbi:Chemotaxis response regulator protein-glutamate methylesterase of group 1 operon [Rosistilla oblonga]|uniref:Protein-glutamate methylesterase/protein-glutamine glutaminase n=1 Tax=Rosistilla oblonga TaxID=2527990 RepID=A0A518IV38_9BACT|nr:Chemotaxis response regulator protein-glutamate methylesterase of group 1 operon [Rosistilla oblonga]QDV56946.1 Chemotaxis response regulator protein-glutamate methylesterase of group 1 operon [Rosistilla oblonga]